MGEDQVKYRRQKYLPQPEGMEDDDYKIYLTRAEFFNGTGRTIDGTHGLINRKEPEIEVDDSLKEYLKNVDSNGSDINRFISDVTKDVMITGFGGILLDAPINGAAMSVKQAEENDVYPYVNFYKCEDIINWRFDKVGRKNKLSLVVLEEYYDEVSLDGFSTTQKKRQRVCRMVDGIYQQDVYEDGKLVSITNPSKKGKSMNYIPFYFLPAEKPSKPMYLDLINIDLAMYRKSADYESGLHFVSVPCPYTRGYTPASTFKTRQKSDGTTWEEEIDPQPIRLVANQFIHFPENCQQVGMLEFTGQGMSAIKEAMNDDEDRMAILGARIISQEKNGVEAAETAKIHRAGENSVLGAFSMQLSSIFTAVFKDYLEWCASVDDVDITIKLNTDYDVAGLSSSDLTALVSAWQSGGISKRVLFHNLKQGEMIPADEDFDKMQSEIEDEGGNVNGVQLETANKGDTNAAE